MSIENICNGKISSLPSLEVVRKADKSPPYFSNLNWYLHIHYARKDFDFCRLIIEKQLKEYLNPEYLYFVRGLIERQEGNNYAALQDFQRAVQINSNNVDTYKEIGKTLYSMGRTKQALDVFKDAKNMINRPDHEIYHYIGEIMHKNIEYKNQYEINEAKAYLEKSIQHGKKLESYQRLANIYEKEKDYSKAIDVLENCLQAFPENVDVIANIGVLYLKTNDTDKAYSKLTEIMNIGEKCSNGLIAYGAILQSRNDIDGALSKYTQISIDDQKSAELWNNIGLCFLKKKKHVLAIACLKKSTWLSPLNYNCLFNLSLIFITAEQYASAFLTLAAAINLRKDNPDIYMLLAICLRKLDDMDNAYLALEKASLLPYSNRNPLISLNFSLLCYETGRIDKSIESFNNFSKIFQNIPLPTEYKFYATKLKSLLQHLAPDKMEEYHIQAIDKKCKTPRNKTNENDDANKEENQEIEIDKENDEGLKTIGDENVKNDSGHL